MFLTKRGYSFKKDKYGVVSYVNNYERNSSLIPHLPNKYKAALLL